MIGKYLRTPEIRKKMSESHKGNAGFWEGKHRSEETKKKLSIAQTGKKLSKKTREKMSLIRIGIKLSEETKRKISEGRKGKKNWNYGKTRPMEVRKKISESTKGDKAHAWKGGITPKNIMIRTGIESRLWHKAVFQRDDFICQKYGIKGGKLNAHHINNFADFPELRTAIDNGITLSEKAHKEFHKIYGKKNNTKEQLQEFLSKK